MLHRVDYLINTNEKKANVLLKNVLSREKQYNVTDLVQIKDQIFVLK